MPQEIKTSRLILNALEAVIVLLKDLELNYAIIGGMALQVWGRERVSKDIDIVISVEGEKLDALLMLLKKLPFSIRFPLKQIGQSLIIFSTYEDKETAFPIAVDLFVAQTEFEKEALKRAIEIEVLGQKLKVVSAEDLLLYKLLADRPIDIVDARSIVQENNDLNKTYLLVWAKKLGVTAKLKGLLVESRQH